MIYIALAFISFCAHFLKGFMGVGINTVTIALASFFIEPKMTIVLASFISIFGSLGMLHHDTKTVKRGFWVPVTTTMFIGGVCGAMALKYIDPHIFEIILGSAFLIISFWMIINPNFTQQSDTAPKKAKLSDTLMGYFGGFCNGFIGLSAVPLIAYFSRYFDKKHLRRFLVLVYLPVSFAQTGTFAINGMLTKQILIYGLIMLPFIFVGLFVGNKAHHKIPEIWFKRILGAFLAFVSTKLILT